LSLQLSEAIHELKWLGEFFHQSFTYQQVMALREQTNFIAPPEFKDVTIDEYLAHIMPKLGKYMTKQKPASHQYGRYENPIDFFATVGIDVNAFGSLRDSYQWYLLTKFGKQEKYIKAVQDIIPQELLNLENFVDRRLKILRSGSMISRC